jgi:D-glycero-D-manno-heptose 1,7-bisphosphate phosphatase
MLIILDRDGVINYDSEDYIKSPVEWIPIPHSLEAITALNKAGHTIVVATNQSGVGRGYYTLETMHQIHEKMQSALKKLGGHIDGIYYCIHTPETGCVCRKPKPGLMLQIKRDYPELFSSALVVGDSLRDLQAAHAAGCEAVLVKTGNGFKTLANLEEMKSILVYESLAHFTQHILNSK